MEKKIVFVVVEEKIWKYAEYVDVVSVHTTKEKAEERVAECKKEFQEKYKDDIEHIRNFEFEEQDRNDFYSLVDFGMGYSYEVSVQERELE